MSRSTSPTIALVPASASVRSGEPDCPYFLVFLRIAHRSIAERVFVNKCGPPWLLVTLRSRSFACGLRSRRPRCGFFSIRCTSVPTCVSATHLLVLDRFPSVSSLKRSKLSSSLPPRPLFRIYACTSSSFVRAFAYFFSNSLCPRSCMAAYAISS